MSSSTTSLPLIIQSQASKEITANNLFTAASPAMVGAYNQQTSSGLTWGYMEGNLATSSGIVFISAGTLTLPASSNNFIEASSSGAVSFTNSGFTSGKYPLYQVTTGTSTVINYTDKRAVSLAITP